MISLFKTYISNTHLSKKSLEMSIKIIKFYKMNKFYLNSLIRLELYSLLSSITSQVNDSFFEMQHNFMGQGHWEALKNKRNLSKNW
jgi:hypothetical protein